MATAAFKSTTRRIFEGDSTSTSNSNSNSNSNQSRPSSSNSSTRQHRRSRSVCPPSSASRRGKFVNSDRGAEFPEISLDDLAIDMFLHSDPSVRDDDYETVSHTRGRSRSVSRRSNDNNNNNNSNNNSNLRRRRSLSVASRTYSILSDSENDHFQNSRSCADATQKKPVQKPTSVNQQRALRRGNSQKDLLRPRDGYSLKDVNKLPGLAVNDSRQLADSDVLKTVSTIRKNYKTKLEESEKRQEELRAKIILEEERGKELKKIVVDLDPNAKEASSAKIKRGRKRSTDRTRVPRQVFEEAEQIIEDFISSVEESDISSFDGERSDTSSVVGWTIQPMMQHRDIESFRNPVRTDFCSREMDGPALPSLKWGMGASPPLIGDDIKQHPATPKTVLLDGLEEMTGERELEESINSKSSRGSWNPGDVNIICKETGETRQTSEVDDCKVQLLSRVPRRPRVDIDHYLNLLSNENTLSEVWRQRDKGFCKYQTLLI
ncbi:uncharacterized protein LOC141652852 isoform X2 [Silene latifolia]|uniref:uncharacterized protein LOC141652852 isoform X2 n=1 Tax=Silene latifolia TaxID=37657 RepID=UPI003D781727